MFALIAAAALQAAAPAGLIESGIEAPGPMGALHGTMLAPAAPPRAVVLIIPGSGATDRDGNNVQGVRAQPYRLLAEALASRGIATVRIDKRGILGSAGAGDVNATTIADYATDVHQWVRAVRARTGARCVWLMGHSEGGLVALVAAQAPADLCGLVLVSAGGRPIGTVLREQLRANPANASLLGQAMPAIDALEAGRHVDVTNMDPHLLPLFAPPIQDYMISLLSYDPAALIGAVHQPVLIVQGQRDLHVGEADARRLAAADTGARLVLVPNANHVLKEVDTDDRAANIATYGDPALPLAAGVVDPIAEFILAPGGASGSR